MRNSETIATTGFWLAGDVALWLEPFYEAAGFPKLDGVNINGALRALTRLISIGTGNINAIDNLAGASNDVGPMFIH